MSGIGRQLTLEARNKAIGLLLSGQTQKTVAKRLFVSRRPVIRWWQKSKSEATIWQAGRGQEGQRSWQELQKSSWQSHWLRKGKPPGNWELGWPPRVIHVVRTLFGDIWPRSWVPGPTAGELFLKFHLWMFHRDWSSVGTIETGKRTTGKRSFFPMRVFLSWIIHLIGKILLFIPEAFTVWSQLQKASFQRRSWSGVW